MQDSESESESEIEVTEAIEATEATDGADDRGPDPSQPPPPPPPRQRGRSPGPGVPSVRARSRSADRTPGAATTAGLMKGKRPNNANAHHSSSRPHPPGQQYKKKRKMVPKRVRKAVPKKVRKVGKKGYKKVKKYGAKPVKKFQSTKMGQRIAPKEKCGTGKICSYCISVILLIASSIGLVFATGNADDLKSLVSSIAPEFDINNLEDPFAGGGIRGIWGIRGRSGLSIEILNALDESWQPVFQLAYTDWNFGTDSLELTPVRVDYDGSDECAPVDGKIKVCNADYGQQPWRGLATCILNSSRNYANCNAKMNDFYLRGGGTDQMQYTMCHELGHTFGLPHTDEVFGNPDLGNCMDYTENFVANKKPDDTNYERLREFYGPSGRRRRRGLLRGAAAGATTTGGTLYSRRKQPPPEEEEEEDHHPGPQPPIVDRPTPPHIWERRKSALEQFDALYLGKVGGVDSAAARVSALVALEEHGWELVEKTLFEEEHALDLGDGYLLQVQLSAA